MKQDLNNIMKKAELQIKEIISLDTDLLTIHQNFPNLSNEDKNTAIKDYKSFLEEREEMIELISDVQEYLGNVIADLNNVKMGKIDKLSHWSKLRRMKKSVEKLVDFDEDDLDEDSEEPTPEIVDKDALRGIISEVKKEKGKEKVNNK